MKNRLVATVAAAAAVLAVAGAALAGAGGKQPTYDANGSASSGTSVLGIYEAGSSGRSTAQNAGSSSDSSASASLLGLGGEAECDAAGVDQAGKQRDADADAFLSLPIGPLSIDVLAAWCRSEAVQQNNARSEAGTAAVSVDADVVTVCVLCSSATTKTTSGVADSDARSAILTVGVADSDVSVLGCESSSKQNNGGSPPGGNTEGGFLVDGVVPLPACPPFTSADSDASYTRIGPEE